MVNVIVEGFGLIPRTNFIAPKRKPFPADLENIKLMLGHGSLRVKIQNPYNVKEFIPVTSNNLLSTYRMYDGIKPGSVAPKIQKQVRASNPANRDVFEKPVTEVKKEEPTAQPEEHQKDKKKEDKNTFKPVGNPEEKK